MAERVGVLHGYASSHLPMRTRVCLAICEKNGDLKLLNVPERIYKIIELLGFTKVLQVFNAEDTAIASFPKS